MKPVKMAKSKCRWCQRIATDARRIAAAFGKTQNKVA